MRIAAAMLTLGLALAAGGAAAQDVAACARIEADLDRLACYDRASGRTPTTTEAPASGKWSVRERKSEFRDTADIFVSVDSEDVLPCGFGRRETASLMLRCMENTTALYVSTSCHLASGFGGYGRVEYRVDDRASKTRNFDDSTDNRALGLWNGNRAIPVIRDLLGGKTLLVRFTPFNENPVTARFPIAGIEEAIKPLRQACKW